MDSSWFLKCGTMNISANISEKKAGCSIGVEIVATGRGKREFITVLWLPVFFYHEATV